MEKNKSVIVIVPNEVGIAAVTSIPGVKAVKVEPAKPIPSSAKEAEILVVGPAEQQSEIDEALQQISQLPRLKLLQTLGQGVEQWDGLLPSSLTVSTARGAHGGSTSEWAVMALLALIRELPSYLKNQQLHQWKGKRTQTLQDANVLVFGVGDLGDNIRSRLLPFGARLTMVGTHSRAGVVDMAKARTLLPSADAVILALPLTDETRMLIDAKFLSLLPNGAIVINAGRGGLIDQTALVEELTAGRLRAALDVVSPEPLPSDSPLWSAPGLILTPHIGGNTTGADARAWKMASKQIRAYINGELNTH